MQSKSKWRPILCLMTWLHVPMTAVPCSSLYEKQLLKDRFTTACQNKHQMSDTAGSEELAPWRGSSSIVWNYFRFGASDVNLERITYKECCRVVTQITHNCLNTQAEKNNAVVANVTRPTSARMSLYSASAYQCIHSAPTSQSHKSPVNTGSNEGFGKTLS